MSETVESLKSVLLQGEPWIALTGAGISRASGIPTYRDHQGKWLGSDPIQHTEFIEDPAMRRRYWSRSALGWPRVASALPNATHYALSTLEAAGILSGVITQNVDRLHQASGAQKVIDLHGRLDRARCLECGQYESRATIQGRLERLNKLPEVSEAALRPDGDADLSEAFIHAFRVPICQHCDGTLMPDVVFFGGTVPRDTVDTCFELINNAQGLMVIGSSLSVYSGYRFCRHAVSQNKPLVILNRGKTRADSLSQYRFSDAPFCLLEQLTQNITSLQQEPANG